MFTKKKESKCVTTGVSHMGGVWSDSSHRHERVLNEGGGHIGGEKSVRKKNNKKKTGRSAHGEQTANFHRGNSKSLGIGGFHEGIWNRRS